MGLKSALGVRSGPAVLLVTQRDEEPSTASKERYGRTVGVGPPLMQIKRGRMIPPHLQHLKGPESGPEMDGIHLNVVLGVYEVDVST